MYFMLAALFCVLQLCYAHEVVPFWKVNEARKSYPEIPSAGSKDPRVNIAQLAKLRGARYLHDLMQQSGLGVYRLKLFEDRVILADPVAIQAAYNTRLTEKSLDFGLANANTFGLRGYLPSSNSNGVKKAIKKRGMWKILKRAQKEHGTDGLYKILKKHWEAVLPTFKPNETSIDRLLDEVKIRTITEFYFGKPFDLDIGIPAKWFSKSLTPKNNPNMKIDDETIELNKIMYGYIDSTPWARTVSSFWYRLGDWRSAETLKSEALFFAFVFSAFSFSESRFISEKSGMSMSVPLFLNLDSKSKNTILEEVERFKKEDGKDIDEKLENFDVTDRFILEIFRFSPPVTRVFARARTNFLLDSIQGRYFIPKGTYFTAFSYGAQRNPYTFRFPNEFAMTGDTDHSKENMFTFGGPYNQKPTIHNRKCLGQDLASKMLKMLITLYAQCDIELVDEPMSFFRDNKPVKATKFKC